LQGECTPGRPQRNHRTHVRQRGAVAWDDSPPSATPAATGAENPFPTEFLPRLPGCHGPVTVHMFVLTHTLTAGTVPRIGE
jgi:hypothetical protein